MLSAVRKVPPGCYLRIDRDGTVAETNVCRARLWIAARGERGAAWREALRTTLAEATRRQMISDVPVGLFLSGGLDSSGLLALARQCTDEQLRAFTVGFRRQDVRVEGQPDDLRFARKVARFLDADHVEIILEPDIVDLLPRVAYHLDEPIADPAAMTSYLICKEARQRGIKVLLSGQGADEVFCGYPWHLGGKLARQFAMIPGPLRQLASWLAAAAPARNWILPATSRRIRKFLGNASDSFESSLLGFLSYVDNGRLKGTLSGRPSRPCSTTDGITRTILPFSRPLVGSILSIGCSISIWKTFLPSLNLAYTDKTSMAHGVEVRVPFLDDAVVDLAADIPPQMKLSGYKRKWILKRALEPLLPKDVVHRKKAGFGAPIRTWIHRDLRPMVRDLLSPARISRRGIFNPRGVEQILRENNSGRRDFAYLIYFLLSFELCVRTIPGRRNGHRRLAVRPVSSFDSLIQTQCGNDSGIETIAEFS